MRQAHVAGEKIFVDYAGATVKVIDGLSGEIREAQIFVAVLGASNTFAEATWTQSLSYWIGSHRRSFEFFGGVPQSILCDYVACHIIRLMCPLRLCGRKRQRGGIAPH